MSVEIRQVSEKELNAFVNFPFELYQNDPYWVGELKADTKHLLSEKNVFWTHGRRALFMAYQNGRAIGRIMALVNTAHNEYHHENIGFFGFFDCINQQEIANALFKAGESWLKAQGVTAVRGPANPSSNHVYGLLVDGFNSMPAIMIR